MIWGEKEKSQNNEINYRFKSSYVDNRDNG